MTIKKLFIVPLIITVWIFPFTMNSADVYEQTKGGGKIISNFNEDIIIGDSSLSSTVIAIKTNERYNEPKIISKCQNSQKVLREEKIGGSYIYFLYMDFSWGCDDKIAYLGNWDEIYTDTVIDLPIKTFSGLFVYYTDMDNKALDNELSILGINNMKYEAILNSLSDKADVKDSIQKVQYTYKKSQNDYLSVLISNILSSRKNLKYIVPIKWKSIPTKKNIIPNANRWYRSEYTDWMHHWWDLFAARWTPVQALWDWVVIRIKKDFVWGDFDKILWKDLSSDDKAYNLDIYRWNQVWLKTADWNVTFYSHLDNIPADLHEWDYVSKWTLFGHVDRTWVPDKEYKDFHLHFEIQMNPHNKTENSDMDIMRWDYFWKWKSYAKLINDQQKLFKQ